VLSHILNNPAIYGKPEASRMRLRRILGNGILLAEGDTHKRQRKVLAPAFATGYIREIVPIFSEKADALVNLILEMIPAQTDEGIEVTRALSRTTLDVIGSAGYSPLLSI
jgi:cytochrome P450